MKELKHTKGEWTASNVDEGEQMWSIRTDEKQPDSDNTICGIWDNSPTAEANAKLIAAAPDLLEALIEVVRISDRKHDAWDKAKAAIKKATT
jgi:hypothetical protein